MSDTPARNTRSSGPTMDEFRALESGQATLGQNLNDQLATLRNKQASDMDEVRAQIHSVSTEQNARFDELQTSINTILRLQGRSSSTDDTSSTAPQVSQPATADTPSVVPATSSPEAPSSTSRPVEMEPSASATGGGVATVSAVPTKQTYNIKSDDISTFDGTPENLELFLARVQAVRFAENDASWDRAVLRAIPLALRGRAAIWHSTLTDRQRSNLFRIDSWFEALRENFSPHPAIVRRQARERAWEYEVEDILGYVFAKVALLKVAYPGLKEGEVVQEVAERLPVEIQMLLRQPHEHQPSLVKFRAELRVQEVFWRRSNLFRIDSWFEALRENFSPHPAIVRRQARERAWEYEVEDILGYVFAKVALLKVAYPGLKEGEVVQEVAERLPVEIQMLLRQPHEHQPSLVKFRAELRVQEVFWRVRYNRPLVTATGEESESTPSKKRTSTFAELVAPSTLAMTPASPSFARGSVAQRRGKPYSEDFDPSRIGQGKSPRTGKDTMFYRVPDTADTIWCERPCRRCGANHFDFAHEHFTTRPQVRFAEEEEDDGYPAASYAAESNDHGDSQSF
ncbi:hypothetical protein A4X13_0g8925 [Tilletia indica]|uniref:Uncharacterized protein n=1 Tax=Tilletia indica TaxID=43049 RepID=A0A8T8SCB9_9BASI|nr:hypothetical protein A4X13_0g8925 [Tilletia indica]